MAEYMLKDRYGKDHTFDNETIYVRGVDGELMPFTQGTVEPLTITENGTYTAPDGVSYNPVNVNVEPVLQDKTITENGEYTADAGYDGLGKVTVEVAGSGGGSLPAGAYWEALDIPYQYPDYNQNWVVFNGELYAFITSTSGNASFRYIYRYTDGAWSLVYDHGTPLNINIYSGFVEYNGKLHFFRNENTSDHWTFDGVSFVKKNEVPASPYNRSIFVQNGLLKMYSYRDGKVYVWDEPSDTWTFEATIGSSYTYFDFVTINDITYGISSKVVYVYKNGSKTKVGTLSANPSFPPVGFGRFIYYCSASAGSSIGLPLYKYDTTTNLESLVTRIPGNGNNRNIFIYQNKITVPGKQTTYNPVIVLHEITE